MYVYVVNNPLAFTDPDGQKPRTINVFVDNDNEEGMKAWKEWAASAQANDKELTVNIYQVSKNTPGTVDAFLDSLKAKDTVTIFSGHSAVRRNGLDRFGITFTPFVNVGNSPSTGNFRSSHSADGVDIQNAVLAVFSCGFGKGFDNLTSSSGTAFVSIIQGPEPTTQQDAVNQAAFRFAKSIATGSWEPLRLLGELNVAAARGQSGIDAFPHPHSSRVNAGDRVDYRILPPPRKRR